jgi:hypothetical protein
VFFEARSFSFITETSLLLTPQLLEINKLLFASQLTDKRRELRARRDRETRERAGLGLRPNPVN